MRPFEESGLSPAYCGWEPGSADSVTPVASEAPAREWLSSHTRILEFWRDRLVEDGASVGLVATIDSQINWLRTMQRANLA
jgi:hypothetical protein